jgi:hypothetical protein
MGGHKTRRLRGGAILSEPKLTVPLATKLNTPSEPKPTMTSAPKLTVPLESKPTMTSAPKLTVTSAPTKVNPEAVIQTLMSSLMRNPSNFPILSRMQSHLMGKIVFNPAVTTPVLSFLTDSLILLLRDPGINTALTTALANLK